MNADHVCMTSHIVSSQRYRIYTVQKPTQRKWLRKKKKQIKKNWISFKKSMIKLSDKQKSLSCLDYLQTVQSFYSSDRDLYSRTLVFFLSVGCNLYASKYTSRELTQKCYGYRLNSIGPLATGSNANHVFFCHVYFHFVSLFCIAFWQ